MNIKVDYPLNKYQKKAIEHQLNKKGMASYSVYIDETDGVVCVQHNTVHLRAVEEEGRGYDGGHASAVREGWPTYHPKPKKGAIVSLKLESNGRFGGYRPYTVSFFLKKVERPVESPLFETNDVNDERLKALYANEGTRRDLGR